MPDRPFGNGRLRVGAGQGISAEVERAGGGTATSGAAVRGMKVWMPRGWRRNSKHKLSGRGGRADRAVPRRRRPRCREAVVADG